MYIKTKLDKLIIIILLSFLCFCSSIDSSQSIGKWKNVDPNNKKINIPIQITHFTSKANVRKLLPMCRQTRRVFSSHCICLGLVL